MKARDLSQTVLVFSSSAHILDYQTTTLHPLTNHFQTSSSVRLSDSTSNIITMQFSKILSIVSLTAAASATTGSSTPILSIHSPENN